MVTYTLSCHACGEELSILDKQENLKGASDFICCPLCQDENIEVTEEETEDE